MSMKINFVVAGAMTALLAMTASAPLRSRSKFRREIPIR
jgi:hypothetical protein